MDRYEFSWTENGVMNAFGLHGASEDCARGIRAGLKKVPSVTNLQVKRISETREDVTGPDPA